MEIYEKSDESEKRNLNASIEGMDLDKCDGQPSSAIKKRKRLDSKAVIRKVKVKHGQPTSEEMLKLRESESLFKSNLFRLEMEELLKEVRPPKTSRRTIKIWLDQFRHSLKSLKKLPSYPLSNLDWVKEQYGIEVPHPFMDWVKIQQQDFLFLAPTNIKMVGSFNSHAAVTQSVSADVLLIVPSEAYVQPKSSYETCLRDYVYFSKRFLYLCVIAHHLMKSNLLKKGTIPEFSCKNGEILKPTLFIEPATDLEPSIGVHLNPVPDTKIFSESILRHHIPNIQCSTGLASPLYNSALASDIFQLANEEMRLEFFKENVPYRDAMRLLKIWLNQRGLNETVGGFSSFIMSMYMIYLSDLQKINKLMSSYQILRIVWRNLSEADWCEKGISLCRKPLEEVPTVSSYHKNFEVVFVDPSGYCNLAARMQHQIFYQVKYESAIALKHLDSSCIKGFQALFITKMNFLRQFDHFISFNNYLAVQMGAGTLTSDDSDWAVPKFITLVCNQLIRCLGKRAKFISYKYVIPNWKVTELRKLNHLCDSLIFGIVLDQQSEALSVIDKGPSANLPEAAEFRELWCGKSEIRRFRDGTVCEAMVWGEADASLSDRLMITRQIVNFIFSNKLHIPTNCYVYVANQLDYAVSLNERTQISSVEEVSMLVNQSLNDLTQKLMALPDLSLSIISVSGISPVNRSTDLFPPLSLNDYGTFLWNPFMKNESKKICQFFTTVRVLIELEYSGKWPKDLSACKRLITAFYVSLAKSLKSHLNIDSVLTTDYLIIRKDGFMFKLEIGNSKLISLIKLRREKGVEEYISTAETEEYETKYFILPKVTSALQGVSATYPGFCGTTRLAKRWLSSQLIDDFYFPTVAVELLVASIFVHPEPYSPPLQPLPAFLRFLDMLAYTNWNHEPIIVNFNQMLTKDEVQEIETYFTENRLNLPALFLVTPYDKFGSLFTKKIGPNLQTLIRLSVLAQSSLKVLQLNLPAGLPVDVFKHKMSQYDVIINLDQNKVTRYYQRIIWSDSEIGSERPKKASPVYAKPPTDFDSVQIYVQKLRDVYNEFALFFYDEYGGTEIGVKFKPLAYNSTHFKYQEAGGRKAILEQGEVCLKFNLITAINDFKELGFGLVLDVVPSSRFQITMTPASSL